MATEVGNLGVEGVLEQRNTVSEGGNSGSTGTSPKGEVGQVRHVWCKSSLRHFVGWASDVLEVSNLNAMRSITIRIMPNRQQVSLGASY